MSEAAVAWGGVLGSPQPTPKAGNSSRVVGLFMNLPKGVK